jgi:hypothetical protein
MAQRALINIGSNDLAGLFINVLKTGGHLFPAGVTPSSLDANGYPSGSYGANNIGFPFLINTAWVGAGTQWVAKFPATRTTKFVINANVSLVSSSGCTVGGGSNSSMTVTSTSSAGRVVFTFPANAGGNPSFYFPGDITHAGSGEIAIMRVSDETAYGNGQYITPEFISYLQTVKAKTIRPMGITGAVGGSEVKWANRTPLTALGWSAGQYKTNLWAGSTSGTDTYTVGAAADTPGSWTDGETLQCIFVNANTSTTPTININARGAKTIVNMQGLPLSAGDIAANQLATLRYDGILGKVLYNGGGIGASVPYEVFIQLANTVGCDLWLNTPPQADDTYISSLGTLVKSTLNSSQLAYFEYSNEVWNYNQSQTQWAYQRGLALGFPNANNEPHHGWYGLRVRQIMGILTSLWSGSNLRRVIAFQAFGTSAQIDTYRFLGTDLDTTKGYTLYNSLIGVSYNAAPNRPIDYCDVLSYATYYSGPNFTNFDANYDPAAVPILQSTGAQYYSNQSAALAWMDNEIRQGQLSAVLGSQTLLGLSQTIYPTWEAKAATYSKKVHLYEGGLECNPPSTSRAVAISLATTGTVTFNATSGIGTQAVNWTAHGLHNGDRVSFTSSGSMPSGVGSGTQYYVTNAATNAFDIRSTYYGATPITPSSTGSPTITAAAVIGLDNLLETYKNSNPACQLVQSEMRQFLGVDKSDANYGLLPHSDEAAWLNITGVGQWAFLQGDITSTNYKTQDAFRLMNSGKRRWVVKT